MKVLDKNSANYMETLPKQFIVKTGRLAGKVFKSIKEITAQMNAGETMDAEMVRIDKSMPKTSMSYKTVDGIITIKK